MRGSGRALATPRECLQQEGANFAPTFRSAPASAAASSAFIHCVSSHGRLASDASTTERGENGRSCSPVSTPCSVPRKYDDASSVSFQRDWEHECSGQPLPTSSAAPAAALSAPISAAACQIPCAATEQFDASPSLASRPCICWNKDVHGSARRCLLARAAHQSSSSQQQVKRHTHMNACSPYTRFAL
jgi:hypothetical protein